ncbi:radical SAM protein, partial [Candidatus Dependentiae bacterium]|nr:radical SAM protein [Candidatus Dependentiae bacterium]
MKQNETCNNTLPTYNNNECIFSDISFGGIEWNSFIDYPGHISIVLFTNGCNFKCEYCHNKFLLTNKISIPHEYIMDNLKIRRKFNDAVVICGGEPTIHPGLKSFIKYLKQLGYFVKLDTNGMNPDVLYKV